MAFSAICETCGQTYYLGMEETPHTCPGPKSFPEPSNDHQELHEILTVAVQSSAARQKKWREANKAKKAAYQKAYRAKA